MKKGFTLAEVLITLGIIGVVAAMTIPTLIANHQKKQVEVKLQRFYSVMAQAIQRYETESGERLSFSDNVFDDGTETLKWYNETIGKYLNTTDKKTLTTTRKHLQVAFNDGSGFVSYITNEPNKPTMFIFYCTEYKYCARESFDGRRTFLFSLSGGKLYTSLADTQNKNREYLLTKCKYGNYEGTSSEGRRHTCTRLIEYDGWQIKDDYPWKQTMLKK